MTDQSEYVLGTHDEEIERLALQHRVWRPQVLDAWHRAGFREGQTIVDIGSGPGNATFDLADLVGPSGKVIALEMSRRFLDVVESRALERGVGNVVACELNLDRDPLPLFAADGAWCRWVMSFITNPRAFITRLSDRIKPGGVFVVHEYFDYLTWRSSPPSAEIELFVRAIMQTWRASGGEPDVGLVLPGWLDEAGFDVRDVRPIVEATSPGEPKWQWLAAFLESGRRRMESLGTISADQSAAIARAVVTLSRDSRSKMITPGVFEIVAIRRRH